MIRSSFRAKRFGRHNKSIFRQIRQNSTASDCDHFFDTACDQRVQNLRGSSRADRRLHQTYILIVLVKHIDLDRLRNRDQLQHNLCAAAFCIRVDHVTQKRKQALLRKLQALAVVVRRDHFR